ncbi:hypothetical protein [Methylobacter tundripaludum]|uniref:Uncharacterized protein n=1 Tax=Methylobacter tundripaludum (strain ATCC BAA-1195 / DSM 17260 / SV96) TaxID=697282 RepID=G3IWW4_METTV|nr:hypothetical protein [Methylobacter tundripaludum]EGW23319.1 hypothetical protein Mettu_2168 [Methylobacter tundripaludum SV96]
MAITYQKKVALFQDAVGAEEAEGLLEWLLKNPKSQLNFADCRHLHAANLQVMMAVKPVIAVWPKDAKLRTWLESALK